MFCVVQRKSTAHIAKQILKNKIDINESRSSGWEQFINSLPSIYWEREGSGKKCFDWKRFMASSHILVAAHVEIAFRLLGLVSLSLLNYPFCATDWSGLDRFLGVARESSPSVVRKRNAMEHFRLWDVKITLRGWENISLPMNDFSSVRMALNK